MSITDVLAEYERIRGKNSIEQRRRIAEATGSVPGLSELLRNIKELQQKRILEAFSGGSRYDTEISQLRLSAEGLLVSNGFSADYLEPVYSCALCKDTGTTENGQRCLCFKKRVLEDKLNEARLSDLSVSFEKFDIDIFDDAPMENGRSQKDYMRQYKKIFESYADDFPGCSHILLISGGIGLGKTYISKCIMRRVMERGYTAAYYTAYRLFSIFHQHRLGEDVDLGPILEVPLLIIDDIGTEPMTKNVTVEYFFDLINERSGLNTVIVTNLPFDEIFARYGERIHSRLMDKNASLKVLLHGKDIRY